MERPGSVLCATPAAPDTGRLDAAGWLTDWLADHDGSAPAAEIATAAKAAGIAAATLKRARGKAGVTSERRGFGQGSVWTLPSSDLQERHSDHSAHALIEPTVEELQAAAVADSDKLLGRTEPRLFVQPLRPLTRKTTRGFEFIDFCDKIGEPLLPWQKWLAIHALELNPDGTFRFRTVIVLVARQNGKSSFKRLLSVWRMYVDGARTILGVAQDVALAREQMNLCKATIRSSIELSAEWGGERNVNGDEMFWRIDPSLPPGAPREAQPRYLVRAANRRAGRGLSIDELNIDELREQRNWDAWSAISKTVMARRYAQIWAMSNAGDDESVVLNQLRAAGLAGSDPSIGLFEWSAPDDCDLDDWDAIAQANPGLGYIISKQAIVSALGTDPPNVYRTEVLCQKVDQLDGAIDLAAWKAQADARGTMDGLRDKLAAVVDISMDSAHVALLVAGEMDDGRVRVEVVEAWNGTDAARDGTADKPSLEVMLDRVKARREGWFPSGPGAVIAPIMRKRANQIELKGAQVTEACQGLADLVAARRVIHPGDPLLDNHIAAAKKLASGDGWRFTRKDAGHVNAAYAAAGAVQLAITMPPPVRPRVRMIS